MGSSVSVLLLFTGSLDINWVCLFVPKHRAETGRPTLLAGYHRVNECGLGNCNSLVQQQ